MMGGQTGVSSTLGQGSTFWFTVVLERVDGGSLVRARLQIRDACEEIAANFAGSRILLAEDNEINMMVATETLAEARLVIDVARDGREAPGHDAGSPARTVCADFDGYADAQHGRPGSHPRNPENCRWPRVCLSLP